MNRGPIVLAAGGTGGHMFPAEALARELINRGETVALITDRRGQAFGDSLPSLSLYRISAGRIGRSLVSKALGVAEIAVGTLEARSLLRRLSPRAAVGFGGYPSVPTMLAATHLGIPAILHEQNAVLGRANRLLARRVSAIATCFTEVTGLSQSADTIETGNPVRPAIAARHGVPYPALEANTPIRILVIGGSQGASILSVVVPQALSRLPNAQRARIRLMQQARAEDIDGVRRAYAAMDIVADLATFFDDVPARLAGSHLVISRSGASTVAELAVVGRPAILVPYLHAMDDHQTANARALANAGAAWVMPQVGFTATTLAARIAELIANPSELATAAAAAALLGRPDAAGRLADLVLTIANGANGHVPPLPQENAA